MRYHTIKSWEGNDSTGMYVTTFYDFTVVKRWLADGHIAGYIYTPVNRECGYYRTDEAESDRTCYQCSIGNTSWGVTE